MDFGKYIFGIDNLFKFLGLSGLIIVAFSFLYPNEMQKEIDFNLIDFKKQQSILNKEVENLKLKLKYLKEDTLLAKNKVRLLARQKDSVLSIGKSNNTLFLEKLHIQKEEIKTKLGERIDALEEIVFQLSLKDIEIESLKCKIDKAQVYINNYTRYFWIFILFGSFLTIYGFFRWHSNQADTDEMQKVQLDIAKEELEKLKKET